MKPEDHLFYAGDDNGCYKNIHHVNMFYGYADDNLEIGKGITIGSRDASFGDYNPDAVHVES